MNWKDELAAEHAADARGEARLALEILPEFARGHRLGKLAVEDPDDPEYSGDQELVPTGLDAVLDAEIITSWTGEREEPPVAGTDDWSALAHMPETFHRPVLDLDFDAALFPSTSADHHHLYLDKVLPWSDYVKLLDVLAEVGIIEPGYRDASIAREFTSVRLPWITKPAPAKPEVGYLVEARGEGVDTEAGPFRSRELARDWVDRNVKSGTWTIRPEEV